MHQIPAYETQLGDIVALPDGRKLTVRSRVTLGAPVGNMAGFLIAGELDVLLATPASQSGEYGVYVPLAYLPEDRARMRLAYEGVTRYWAPHLPALGMAMAELAYEVHDVRGSLDPIVVVNRGNEQVVFIKASTAWGEHLRFFAMPRTDNEQEIARRSATVVPIGVPTQVPQHEEQEQRQRRWRARR